MLAFSGSEGFFNVFATGSKIRMGGSCRKDTL